MLIMYYIDLGVTNIVVPLPLQPYLGQLVNLSWGYCVYMAAVAIFCPNTNIYAGINGLEVAQSIAIAVLIMANDLLYIRVGGRPPGHRLTPFLAALPAPVPGRFGGTMDPEPAPGQNLRGGHVLLFRGHDVCGGGNPGPLL